MDWELARIEGGYGDGYEVDRPEPGEGDDTCEHGFVVYGEGDCDLCDEAQAADEAALAAAEAEEGV